MNRVYGQVQQVDLVDAQMDHLQRISRYISWSFYIFVLTLVSQLTMLAVTGAQLATSNQIVVELQHLYYLKATDLRINDVGDGDVVTDHLSNLPMTNVEGRRLSGSGASTIRRVALYAPDGCDSGETPISVQSLAPSSPPSPSLPSYCTNGWNLNILNNGNG
jgi:hypothetical protein